MKYLRYLIIYIIVIFIPSCDVDSRLKIINNSNEVIYFLDGYTYPDTSIEEFNPINDYSYRCGPMSKHTLFSTINWESAFKNRLNNDTLMIFIFSADTLRNVLWERVRKEYKILKRYDLSYQDLIDRHWEIIFP